MEIDALSLERVQKLHPKIRGEAEKILRAIYAKGIRVRFTHTLRTFEEQAKIYAQGRTTKGNIVTYARAGMSWHNYGLAIDICLLVKNGASWDERADFNGNEKSDWLEIVAIFEAHGWTWGGRWKGSKRDGAHFQKTLGLTVGKALSMHRSGALDGGYINV